MTTRKAGERTLRYKMIFPAKIVGEPIMTNLSRDFGISFNMVRGRITEKGAWLTLDITGSPKNIERALLSLREREVKVELVKE
jgi:ABC-type methionine transport system ATPase subunit